MMDVRDMYGRASKTGDEDSYSTDSRVSGEEFGMWSLLIADTFFGFNLGQSYLATLVTPQNCTQMLRNLTFVV